jgi:thiopurine S-methyltransferase
MDIAFWASRWNEGKIGFHEGKANQYLVRHGAVLGEGRNVLVPLCGKTEDLAYLAARGHHVVGIEVVEKAVRAFYQEHGLTPTVKNGRIFEAAGVTIILDDLFNVTREDTGPVDALYDRAALIALPPEIRGRYVAKMRELLSPGAKGLLVTLTYAPDSVVPPPHAIFEPEVRALYNDAKLLENDPANDDRFKDGHNLSFELTL